MTVQKAAMTCLARALAGASVEDMADRTGRNTSRLTAASPAASTHNGIGWGACLVQG